MLAVNLLTNHRVGAYQESLMKIGDRRLKLVSEVLDGIKVIKLHGWEPLFSDKIISLRRQELRVLLHVALFGILETFAFTASKFWMTFCILAAFVALRSSHHLDAKRAFLIINYINIINIAVLSLPLVVKLAVKMRLSIERISEFLQTEEVNETDLNRDNEDPCAIRITKSEFKWETAGPTILRDINVEVMPGQLVAVVGTVGSGKSSLLAAALGEMVRVRGHTNINGINLSGGQKQRVSLARAVYSQADIYLLDDPLSAVDSHVGKSIFQKVIGPQGLLNGKTRILVTHGLQWLPYADHIYVMEGGKIKQAGTYTALTASADGEFSKFVEKFNATAGQMNAGSIKRRKAIATTVKMPVGESDDDASLCPSSKERDGATGSSGLITDERREDGQVKWAVYFDLFRAYGWKFFALTATFVFCFHSTFNAFYVLLSAYTDDRHLGNFTELPAHGAGRRHRNRDHLLLLAYCGIAQTVFTLFYASLFQWRHVTTSRVLHLELLRGVMRAPISFFETTPKGRILNRFSQDLDSLDSFVFFFLEICVEHGLFALGILAVISYALPMMTVITIPTAVAIYFLQITTELKAMSQKSSELESNIVAVERIQEYSRITSEAPWHLPKDADPEGEEALSPSGHTQPNHLTLKVSGSENATPIRSGSKRTFCPSICIPFSSRNRSESQSRLTAKSTSINSDPDSFHAEDSLNKRNFLSNCFPWERRSRVEEERRPRPATYGSVSVKGATANCKNGFTKIDRSVYNSDQTIKESDHRVCPKDERFSTNIWPQKGRIQFVEFSCRYRRDTEQVLKRISFVIRGGEKDPVLFAGSLRDNLDPAAQRSEVELWKALEQAHLRHFVQTLPGQLDATVGDGGNNLRILVLDQGRALEFDSPSVLMADHDSAFFSLAKEAGLADRQNIISNKMAHAE
ncbi:multidrug resistance-associated protein 1 [Elysia marginata]|uniref:Multidrug resistance-associated protein 1 n=1 Tax=Elysia marginata TaxID=1093978 RepID=A0AAV4JMM1_9GAST|nr:multidrug resistance-associated protein 1 [Elysia marginata]